MSAQPFDLRYPPGPKSSPPHNRGLALPVLGSVDPRVAEFQGSICRPSPQAFWGWNRVGDEERQSLPEPNVPSAAARKTP